jgi:GNAT superfamily N-acetyltransferase
MPGEMRNEIYFTAHHKLIEGVLRQCKVVVACSKDDDNQIFGWGTAEEVDGVFVVHYLYVKSTYRKLGIAQLIFKALGGDLARPYLYTHKSFYMQRLERKHDAVYYPYLAYKYYVLGSQNEE